MINPVFRTNMRFYQRSLDRDVGVNANEESRGDVLFSEKLLNFRQKLE